MKITEEDVDFIRSIYSDYLSLTDYERTQLDGDDIAKLNIAVDTVVQIENDTIKSDTIKQRINNLPAINDLTLANEKRNS